MSSTGAQTKLIQRLEAQTQSFSSQSSHSVEFIETVSESSSVSLRTVDIQTEMSSESSVAFKPSAGPRLLKEMSDVRVQSGDMAEFSCSFDGQPFVGVVWDHNGHGLVDTERLRSSESGGLMSLVIQSVGVADQGVYRCTATNQHGHSSCSAQLTVEGG